MAVEEPAFKVIFKEGAFEVRDYPSLVAAEVVVGGDRNTAATAGFKLLASYIFGENTRRQTIAMTAPVVLLPPNEKIPMTAPVIQTGSAGSWTVRFVMPRAFSLETLPRPNSAQVHLTNLPASRVGVLRFSGLANESDVVQKAAELGDLLATHKLNACGPVSLARYNPPWTPWFVRRNEVMAPLQDGAAPR